MFEKKPQACVIVERSAKKKATWIVKVQYSTHPDDPSYDRGYAILPGDFRTKDIARGIANEIAKGYRLSGCNVVVDTTGRHRWRT
jgi:hypothetical protein